MDPITVCMSTKVDKAQLDKMLTLVQDTNTLLRIVEDNIQQLMDMKVDVITKVD